MDAVKLSHFEPTVGLNTISGGVNPVTDTRAYGAETGGLKALQGAVGVAPQDEGRFHDGRRDEGPHGIPQAGG